MFSWRREGSRENSGPKEAPGEGFGIRDRRTGHRERLPLGKIRWDIGKLLVFPWNFGGKNHSFP